MKLKTFRFFIASVKRITPKLLIYQLIVAVLKTVEILLTMYIPSLLIILLSGGYTQQQTIIWILLSLLVLWLCRVINRIMTKESAVLESLYSKLLLKELSQQITSTTFSQIEDSSFIAQKEEALFPIRTQNAIQMMFRSVPIVFQSVIGLVSVLSILLLHEPILAVIAFIVPCLSFLVGRKLIAFEAAEAKQNARANSEYVYYLRTMHDPAIAKDVRVYQMQSFFAVKYEQLFDKIVKSIKKLYISREMRGLINQTLSIMLMISIYSFLIYKVIGGFLTVSTFVLLVNATVSFNDQMNTFFSEILMLNQQLIYLQSFQAFQELLKEEKPQGNILLNEEIKSIEFKNVTFRYPKSETDVLKGCSFKIEGRQNLSIVGRNGSGKTTIIKLISRLYQPQQGEILVNGININEYEEASYLTQLSIIFQDFKTFQYSIKENIIFDKDEDNQRLQYALNQSELIDELPKFSQGIDTNLIRQNNKKAVTLSKGQEQKLVIARAIYNDGSLLILDEPTASLDPLAEEEVYSHFQEITKDKLAIFISHRLSSCRFSDQIIYLEDGKVLEKGNHQDLMNLKGKYCSLFKLQGSKYQVDKELVVD